MYGWEFPPRISGGLGVACHAIVNELSKKAIDLTLVLPYSIDNDQIDSHLQPTKIKFINVYRESAQSRTNHSTNSLGIESGPARLVNILNPYPSLGYTNNNFDSSSFLSLAFKTIEALHLDSEMASLISNWWYSSKTDTKLIFEVLRYALIAGRLASSLDYDIIHAHDWLTILAALEAKFYHSKPVVFHIHALETDRSGSLVNQEIYAIEKYGMELADRIIAVSHYTKENIIKYYHIDPRKISVVHNGIYLPPPTDNHKAATTSPPMVLFLGRVTHQKGPYFFIQTAKKVLEKKPDTQFVIAGTGDLLINMIEQVAKLRIGKNVHFTGFLDQTQVKKIYQLASIYVMPSVSEPFGLSALEALSHQVPSIISKQAGVNEVLNHVLVSDFWDIDDLAGKILAVLEYQTLGKYLANHSHSDLKRISWEEAANKIIDLYQTIL